MGYTGHDLLLHTSSSSYTGKVKISTGNPNYGEAGDIEMLSGKSGQDSSSDGPSSGKISIATSPSSSTYYNGNTGDIFTILD